MKKSKIISGLILIMFAGGVLLTTSMCNRRSAKEAANTSENVAESAADNVEVQVDSVSEIEKFRLEAKDKIRDNEDRIAELKAKMKEEKKEMKAAYDKKIEKLEKKNSKLKTKIAEYKEQGKENWAEFKREFNHDMDELGASIKDFWTNNKN